MLNFSKNDLINVNLKKTTTEEKSISDTIGQSLGKVVDKNEISKQEVKIEAPKAPSGPPPKVPEMNNKPKEKKVWKVELNEPKMEEKNIQIDPDIDTYPKHDYDDILCVSIQAPFLPAQQVPNFIDNFLSKNFKDRKPDFLLLPEDSFGQTTFSGGLDNNNKLIAEVAKIIKKHQVYVILGTTAEVVMDGNKRVIYNTTPFFNRNGILFGTYRKRKSTVGGAEGKKVGIFKTQFGLMGVMICFDIENKDIYKETLLYKPSIIFNPTYIPLRTDQLKKDLKLKQQSLSSLFEKSCLENNLTIIRSDQRNMGFASGCSGSSQIITPVFNERSSDAFETFIITYVPKNQKELSIYQNITIPSERTRSLETDNIDQRYFIDNFNFSSPLKQCSFLNETFLVGLDEKNHLIVFNSETNMELLNVKSVKGFNIFEKELIYFNEKDYFIYLQNEETLTFPIEEKDIECISFNDKYILLGSQHGSLIKIDRKDQKILSNDSISKVSILSIKYLFEQFILISMIDSLMIYDYENNKILFESNGQLLNVKDKIIYFKKGKDLIQWNFENEKLVFKDFIYSKMVLLNDKKWFVIEENQMKLFNAETSKIDFVFKSHYSKINSIEFNQLNMVLTGDEDGLMKCWEFQNNRMMSDLKKLFKN